jgi:transcriptional regulator with XRE-family HTH domain
MDSNVTIISKVISNKYDSSKLSKREIALKTGLSRNTVNNALTGKNLTVNTLFKIMECLDMNLEDVVNEAKKMNLSFPKTSNKSQLNSDQVKKLLDGGNTIAQIAAKLGVLESEVEANLQAQMKVPATKKAPAEVFEVA